MYFRMCARALVHFRSLVGQLDKIDHLDPRYDTLFEQIEEAAVGPVIFAGMCLEATLYDLAACLFGEEFIAHTEKLDPIGKYFVIAKSVDKEAPSKSCITYQSIQSLVTARNKLIHHKSQSAVESDFAKIFNRAKKEHEQHVNGIAASFRALVLLSLHFDGNILEELRIIPSFKKPAYWIEVVPKELHEDIKWCIQASLKERRRSKSPPSSL